MPPWRSLILLLVAPALLAAQEIEISPHRKTRGKDASSSYVSTPLEKKIFLADHPDVGKPISFGVEEADSLKGKVGREVAWFGIVREIKDLEGGKHELTIQHTYYDGLNDLHMQLASINGAGDFTVLCEKFNPDLKRLCLIRVIGKVTDEKDGVPTVTPDFIRVWRQGDFAFMDYGKDASNPKWIKLRHRRGPIYDPEPNDNYYREVLGN